MYCCACTAVTPYSIGSCARATHTPRLSLHFLRPSCCCCACFLPPCSPAVLLLAAAGHLLHTRCNNIQQQTYNIPDLPPPPPRRDVTAHLLLCCAVTPWSIGSSARASNQAPHSTPPLPVQPHPKPPRTNIPQQQTQQTRMMRLLPTTASPLPALASASWADARWIGPGPAAAACREKKRHM
jgi:hypothetical protein